MFFASSFGEGGEKLHYGEKQKAKSSFLKKSLITYYKQIDYS